MAEEKSDKPGATPEAKPKARSEQGMKERLEKFVAERRTAGDFDDDIKKKALDKGFREEKVDELLFLQRGGTAEEFAARKKSDADA